MKRYLNRLTAVLLIAMLALTPSLAAAYQPDTSGIELIEIASVDFSTGSTDNAAYSGGRIENGCLVIAGTDGESKSVNLDIQYDTRGRNCYADICYLDVGNNLFAVSYRNSRSQGVQTEITEGNGTGSYITKTLYLPDFCTADGSDISVKAALTNPSVTGEDLLYIKSITLYTDNRETINIDALTDKPGNIFYDGEAISFDASFSGTAEGVKNLDVKCNVYKRDTDMTEVLYNSSEFTVRVDGAATVHYPLLLTVDDFALYTLEITATSDDSYGYTKVDFSKSLINKESNPSLGACVHLVRFGDADAELRLIKNAGFSTVRDDFTWWEYETVKGRKQLSARQKNLLDTCKEYGIEPLLIVYGNNALYDTTASDLVSDEYMDEFKSFVASAVPLDEFDIVKRIEVWNEPSATHTLDGEDIYSDFAKKGEQYAKILTAAYDVIKDIRPDIEVGALSLSGMESANARTFVTGAMNYLSENTDYQPFDAVSYHPYLFGYEPEYAQEAADSYNTLIEPYGFSVDNVWYTEYGYSTGNPAFVREFNAKTEMEQAALTLRKYAALKSADNTSTSWIYDFADDSIRDNVENASHGLVYSRYSSTPYSAKPAYLAVSALNRLTGDATACSEQSIGSGTVFNFSCPNREVYLMYNTEAGLMDYEIAGENVYYYDIFGNPLSEEEVMTEAGYKVSDVPFYAVTGEKLINQAIDDTAIDMPIMNISGSIASGLSEKNISVIVLGSDEELSAENVMNALYVDQQKTGISGTFDFNVRFESAGAKKAYVISEDSSLPIELNLYSVGAVDALNLTSGMVRIGDGNISMLNVKDMSVLLNREYIKEATDYAVIMALYNGDKLVYTGVGKDAKADLSDSTVVSYKFSSADNPTYDRIKIFVWDSLSELRPLLDARIYLK